MRKKKGTTFVEMLLANCLSSFLLVLLLHIYLVSKSSFILSEVLGAIQENAIFTAQVLTRAIQEAGLNNCNFNELMNEPSLMGYHSQIPEGLSKENISGSDILVIRKCDWQDQKLQYVEKSYFIANTNRKNLHGKPIYALYEKINEGNRQELIANIVDMVFLFGMMDETGRNIEGYLTADIVADWSLVRSVKIDLLLNSQEDVLLHAIKQQIAGNLVAAEKQLFKHWFFYAMRRQ